MPSKEALTSAWLGACFCLIYLGDIGRGFVKDDFSWILHSRPNSGKELWHVLSETPLGFFRPLVNLSFTLNYWLFDLAPFGYALTNLALAVGIAIALACLARKLGLDQHAAIVAAGLWLFNFHGVGMALMWISGRTSLLATLWASLAAVAFTARRFMLAGFLVLLSLLSKEEPLLLPFALAAWAFVDRVETPRMQRLPEIASAVWPSFAALGIYLILRWSTDAITPATAPSFYRLSTNPLVILRNAVSYLDRSLTLATAMVLVTAVVCGQMRVSLSRTERAVFLKGLAWLVCGFGISILVPIRSSLYVCLPSIGSALVGSTIIAALWRTSSASRQRAVVMLFLFLPLALLPIYRARNSRMKAEAVLAATVIAEAAKAVDRDQSLTRIVLYDTATLRPSLRDAFGGGFPEAIQLALGNHVKGEIAVREGEASVAAPGVSPDNTAVFELATTGIVRLR